MSAWPTNLTVAPIREWPGDLTRNRVRSGFRSSNSVPTPLSVTLEQLDRELRMLAARDAEMLVAIAPGDFRRDGRPRAQAKAQHPGVILSFRSPLGQLSYPCDRFTTWQDNLRAIVLALEALRKVDRYGVTKRGEQYRGFLAIEAAAPVGFTSARTALGFLIDVAFRVETFTRDDDPARILRVAKRVAHPDTGGDTAEFQRVMQAEAVLRGEGLL